jgi:hypothetical protein
VVCDLWVVCGLWFVEWFVVW